MICTSLAPRVILDFYKFREECLHHSIGRSSIMQVNALTILRELIYWSIKKELGHTTTKDSISTQCLQHIEANLKYSLSIVDSWSNISEQPERSISRELRSLRDDM
jgi:hypothetical protein